MHRFTAHTPTKMLTFLLILSVSVCCCQARLLADSTNVTEAKCSAGSAGIPSCCAAQSTDENEQESPASNCCDCCLKATHVNTADAELLKFTTADVTAISTVTEIAVLVVPEAALLHRNDFVIRYSGDPPTLLRLRCALII